MARPSPNDQNKSKIIFIFFFIDIPETGGYICFVRSVVKRGPQGNVRHGRKGSLPMYEQERASKIAPRQCVGIKEKGREIETGNVG